MEISFPFVACVRTAGRKKICQIVAVRFLQGGLGPFRGLDAPRAPKTNDNSWLMAKSTAARPHSRLATQRMVPGPQHSPHTSFPSRTRRPTSNSWGGSSTSQSAPSSAKEIGNGMQAFRHWTTFWSRAGSKNQT